jgi:hypothetical protein
MDSESVIPVSLGASQGVDLFAIGQADAVLALLESHTVQASFISDRAAFLSFLVILSSSSKQALLCGIPSAPGGGPQRERQVGTHPAVFRRQCISCGKWR